MADLADVCFIGKVDDGTLRVCCSAHGKTLCARHYARTHFVEVSPEWDADPCDAHLKAAARAARLRHPPKDASDVQRYDGDGWGP